ncbi:Putative dipeptidase SA1572 [Slackia heliotrinireducens]|uniref:Dipeptidase, putative n=1 Tax=Slackia heliotrinireducens (strain ATCC 29202 / DSM 20476 / NCTC 11029 / RHS 1) TaxID=471855 RepID=C7N1J9_SLAHD|nr:Sapep family Mn(2+)-dependent dipeptidase [Slackia heliotrinireducens]ACV21291.1 dipeptidase, putative [Slackia heliotrinireducens DSM 20476]VEG98726.1 Putative dipeptidase SA1572 [Slackia heliotrinireducens]
MADEELLRAADEFIASNWEDIVSDIAKMIAVPSVVDFDAATPEHPSGPAAHEGLKAAVALAERLGFESVDDAGEIGFADLPGTSDTLLAMICHADVVAPGIGWTLDPWTMLRKDGFLLGRGVIDDKGPLVIALYAMKFFQERDARLPYTLRMIFGTNEETGCMRDVAYYQEKYGSPAFLFTPDNTFPVCYGEKGGYRGILRSPGFENGTIVDFTTGGSATNAVPGLAKLTLKAHADALPPAEGIAFEAAGDGLVTLTATGVAGHAAMPEGTVSAIGMLVAYLLEHNLTTAAESTWLRGLDAVIGHTDGSGVGIACSDEDFGPLTCVAGTIHRVDDRFNVTLDLRYPTTITPDEMGAAFAALAEEFGGSFSGKSVMEPFLMDKNSDIIRVFAEAYHDATGLDGDPFTSGGATYAREFPRAVSFGVEDPHDSYPAWVGGMHAADEGVSEETLKRALRTYILTISRLMELDLDRFAGEHPSAAEAAE